MIRSSFCSPESLLLQSLHEFQFRRSIPSSSASDISSQLSPQQELQQQLLQLKVEEHQHEIQEYGKMENTRKQWEKIIRKAVWNTRGMLPYMRPGRCVYVENADDEAVVEKSDNFNPPDSNSASCSSLSRCFGWGIVINFHKHFTPDSYVIDVLLPVNDEMQKIGQLQVPTPRKTADQQFITDDKTTLSAPTRYEIVAVHMSMITAISIVRLFVPPDLRLQQSRQQFFRQFINVQQQFQHYQLPTVNIHNMKCDDKQIQLVTKLQQRCDKLSSVMENTYCGRLDPESRRNVLDCWSRMSCSQSISRSDNSTVQSPMELFRIDLKNRLRILRRLKHIDEEGVLLQKGRVAAEIDSVDEVTNKDNSLTKPVKTNDVCHCFSVVISLLLSF